MLDKDRTYELSRKAGFEVVELLPVQKRYRWQWRSQVLLGPRCNWLNRLVVRALERLPEIDRSACRQRVAQCFSIKTMVEAYERVYSTIFELEAKR